MNTLTSTQTACDRLAQSRERMRQALHQSSSPTGLTHVKLIAKTAYGVVATVARNHPVAAVAGTALIGAMLVRARASRWLSVSALFTAFVPQLFRDLVVQKKF